MLKAFETVYPHILSYFQKANFKPQGGFIDISGERYILVRAASLAKEFFGLVQDLYRDAPSEEALNTAYCFLFDMAHAIGRADARRFHCRMGLQAPEQRLAAWPLHFAHTGWAYVKILPDSRPVPGEDFFLHYEHKYSFEVDSWLKNGEKVENPVCVMNAGYSSGWCEVSFGIPLVAAEVECRAMGDPCCRFVMAHRSRIEGHFRRYAGRSLLDRAEKTCFLIQEFFSRKRLEKELRESEEAARALLNAPPERAMLLDADGTFLALNEPAARAFGMTREEIIGRNAFREMLPPELRAKRKAYHDRVVESGLPLHYEDEREGKRLSTNLYPVFEETGKVTRVAIYSQDITEQKRTQEELARHREYLEQMVKERTAELMRANDRLEEEIAERKKVEQSLRASEERYRNLVEGSFDGLFLQLGTKIVFTNRRLQEMLGYGPAELEGMDHWLVYHPEDQELTRQRARARLRGETPQSRYEVRMQRKDGSSFPAEIIATPLRLQGEPGIQVSIRDISERKRAEAEREALQAQVEHGQRMEALGTLAGGVAHDFNNLLMAIQGNVSLLRYELDPNHPYQKSLQRVEEQVKRGAKLTSQLLGYARKGRFSITTLDLNALVRETVSAFGRTRKDIRIHLDLGEDLRAVEADQGQIDQVILNLCINASDAMPKGGELFLETANVTNKQFEHRAYTPNPGHYVMLRVRDTGCGMDEETLNRIFEPFFTTKEPGKGTGLGLACVYGIVKAHGGYIHAESDVGKGTLFSVYLPASKSPQPSEFAKRPSALVPGRGAILMADDEEMVLDVGARMLEKLGYRVYEAPGGREALRIFEEHGAEIDLVILDMIMPDMGGEETFDRIRDLDPNVPILLASGFTELEAGPSGQSREWNGFISKPFSLGELSEKVALIIGRGKNPNP
ncbi:MAG: PAS domain S-box protein [Deltaproteobacteria bacterium]|nr:PAS domain S-box protein [Deltaproteobacteria bacterium]